MLIVQFSERAQRQAFAPVHREMNSVHVVFCSEIHAWRSRFGKSQASEVRGSFACTIDIGFLFFDT